MQTLNGRESTLLALLAQSGSLTAASKRRILATLDGRALEVARVLAGVAKRPSRSARIAAEGLWAWARNSTAARAEAAALERE